MEIESNSVLAATSAKIGTSAGGGEVARLLRYRPQLDGLRAIAVLGVLVEHFWGSLAQRQSWGHYGVVLFFVLSGYLITGILLSQRDAMARGVGLGSSAKRFYIRRCLRIFPAYYLTLLLLWRWGYTSVRDPMPWHLTYTTNIWCALHGVFPGVVGPYWSLSVEEQFYLIWPWFILLTPGRALGPAIVAVAFLGPLSRAALVIAGFHGLETTVLPTSCLDSLAGGAFLAWSAWGRGGSPCGTTPVARWGGRIGAVGMFVLIALNLCGIYVGVVQPMLQDSFLAGLFCWVVGKATNGFGGFVGVIMDNIVARFIGRISYGIYLYHFAVLYLIRDVISRVSGRPWHPAEPLQFLVCGSATIVVASLSWYLFEKPILRLKSRFEY